jgi:two-component system NtrC family sensor kinase
MVLTIVERPISLILPHGVVGWILWASMAIAILYLLHRLRSLHPRWSLRSWLLFAFLFSISPLTALFFAFPLSVETVQLSAMVVEIPPPTIMVLLMVPMLVASGILGPVASMLLGIGAGGLYALYSGGTLFTPLEFGFVGLVFSGLMRQRFRTPFFRWLSHPAITALAISSLYPLLFFILTVVSLGDSLVVRLDYASTRVIWTLLTFGVPMAVAAILAQFIHLRFPVAWHGAGPLRVAPGEASLKARMLSRVIPWIALWSVFVFLGSWYFTDQYMHAMVDQQLQETAETVASGFPYFQEIGHTYLKQIGEDEQIASDDPLIVEAALADALSQFPYFSTLSVWRATDQLVSAYPDLGQVQDSFSQIEYRGLQHAFLDDIPFQSYSVPPVLGVPAEVSFILKLPGADQENSSIVLVGRTRLDENPMSSSLLAQLNGLSGFEGGGALVNESGHLLYHSNTAFIGQAYRGENSPEPYDREQIGLEGLRQMVYYQPVTGYAWAVVASIPISYLLQIKLSVVLPIMAITASLSALSFPLLRNFITRLSDPLKTLQDESSRMASGELEMPLQVDGIDEVGQLARSFENMRQSLKSQIDEISQYLVVSRGMSSTLEMGAVVRPALEAALSIGADAARLALAPTAMPEEEAERPLRTGIGPAADRLAGLDKQVLALNAQQPEVFLSNPARARLTPPDGQAPAAVFAAALIHEGQQLGSLWVAFERPRQMTPDEIRFINTLASQLALSITNARLYRESRLGWQRLQAVLAATPDAVLVTDANDELIVANPAADVLFRKPHTPDVPRTIADLTNPQPFEALLGKGSAPLESVEIPFPAMNKTFLASAAPIIVQGLAAGRVCVLRDITEYKQLNTLMSDFVSAVSHDLRNPLALVQGYATMLGMVGDLNEQQDENLQRILGNVERMTKLTGNLLDLSRFETGPGLSIETLDAGELLADIVGVFEPTAARQGVALRLDLPARQRLSIQGDATQLRSAWQNLIDNGLKFTPQGGQVRVSVSIQQDTLQVMVEDNGRGIAPLDIPRVFDRFYRIRQEGQAAGSGLGLSIVKAVAERHRGQVRVESQLGQGTRFVFEIPIRQPQR